MEVRTPVAELLDPTENSLRWLEEDRLHEECGVFGIFNHPDAAALTALGLHALQHRVEMIDLRPIGVLSLARAGMRGGKRCLDLIGAGAVVAHCLVDQHQSFSDQSLVPFAAILIVEQDHLPVRIEARRQPRLLQQH